MGSPLSPILADLVMNNLLQAVTKDIQCEVPVLKKYVDDFILALPADQIHAVLQTFNSYNPHLQFTCETETHNKLPFLDTLITRHDDQSLSTSWYSKPIASGRMLNFHSFHPTAMKMNVAQNFINRVVKLTTNQPMEQQKTTIFRYLRRNNYPAALINGMLSHIHNINMPNDSPNQPLSQNNTPPPDDPPPPPIPAPSVPPLSAPPQICPQPTDTPNPSGTDVPTSTKNLPAQNITIITQNAPPTIHQDQQTPPPAPPNVVYRSIPFIPQLTSNIAHSLKRDYPQIQLAYRTTQTVKNILKQVKDPTSTTQRSKVIYSIPCNDCEMTYIGMTKNKLTTRLSGHQTHINKLDKLRQTNTTQHDEELTRLRETTALMDHAIQNNHKFNLNKTVVLDQARREPALPILEMCHIANTTHTVNYRTDVDNLNTTYAGILHTIKNYKSRKQRQADLDNNT